MKISESFKNLFDFILLIGIHIFIPVFYVFFTFYMMGENAFLGLLLFDDTKFRFIEVLFGGYLLAFLDFVFVIFVGLRFCILPVTYNFLEKKSKNNIIKKIIYNLKNNRKVRYITLIVSELPFLSFYIAGSYYRFMAYVDVPTEIMDFLVIQACITLFADLLGCYIVLFLWWKFADIYKQKF